MSYMTTEQLIARDGKDLTDNQQALLCLRLKATGMDSHDPTDHLLDVMCRRLPIDNPTDRKISDILRFGRTSEPSGEPSQDPWERIAQIAGELQASTQSLITAIQAQTTEA